VNHQPDRDRSLEPLLRQSLRAQPGEATPACLDAETIGAFVDGGLSKLEMTSARNHLADCARCQSLLAAMARIEPPAEAAKPHARSWLTWAIPLTAAAAVVGIYIAIPKQPGTPAASPVSDTAAVAPTAPNAAPPPSPASPTLSAQSESKQSLRQDAPQAAAPEALRKNSIELRREAEAFKGDTQTANAAPPASAPRALRDSAPERLAAAKTEAVALDQIRPIVASPDSLVWWRPSGSNVERSIDGGQEWQLQITGASAPLTSGSAVSATIVWFVGQRGLVLLSTDGQTWRRLTFPETADLTRVRARDANSANVTTSDGRTFSTTDAGANWVPRPLQDF
jgi:hypothetical protein